MGISPNEFFFHVLTLWNVTSHYEMLKSVEWNVKKCVKNYGNANNKTKFW